MVKKSAQSPSEGIKKGDKVSADYEGTLDDGTVFDSSSHGDHSHPLEFEVGAGQVIPGFENGVIGMKVGEEKKITIESGDAYGKYRDELVKEIPRSQLPQDPRVKEGVTLMLGNPQSGQQIPVTVAKLGKDKATIDLNHPLAGKRLHFTVKIAGINEPSSAHHHHH